MVATIPRGIYTMMGKISIIRANAKIYQRSSKKVKTRMLTELVRIIGMNRQYLSLLLRKCGKVAYRKGRLIVIADPRVKELSNRGRKKIYGDDVLKALKKIWKISGFVSSKHLVAFIKLNCEALFSHPELRGVLTESVKEKVLSISHATVDRALKPYRDIWKFKRRRIGNPFSSNVKRSVKVESWFDKPKEPGYMEIDLVHHSGETGKGDFIYTLTATEIVTGWTELRALRNKAMIWTKEAIEEILKTMPLEIKKIHSDNGTEFINAHILRFCRDKGIEYTRSRPYRKNDAPYVESKNWSMVRVYTGWRRYDSEEELKVLTILLKLVSIRQNLFMPQMKLIKKEREGGKVKRFYEMDTPLNRVLKLNTGIKIPKERLVELKNSIDIVKLAEDIDYYTAQLDNAYEKKRRRHIEDGIYFE